jgi:phosphate transport system substrate-binding protein
VLGAPQSTEPGGALLAVLLQSGCRQVLLQATDEQCQSVRGDDVYIEVPEYRPALVRELLAHPTWLGLLNLELLTQNRDELAVSPLNDVIPGAASVLSGAYPAARSLYLYVSTSDLASRPVLGNLIFRYRQLLEEGAFGGPDAALVSSQELQDRLQSP